MSVRDITPCLLLFTRGGSRRGPGTPSGETTDNTNTKKTIQKVQHHRTARPQRHLFMWCGEDLAGRLPPCGTRAGPSPWMYRTGRVPRLPPMGRRGAHRRCLESTYEGSTSDVGTSLTLKGTEDQSKVDTTP